MQNIAVFYDAENISAQYVPLIIEELKKIGSVRLQYAYADWSLPTMRPWNEIQKQVSLSPKQLFHNGEKQVTDKQIMMDAVEVACTKPDIDTLAIVSSDKGFSILARKLHDLGKNVIGVGERKSSPIWPSSCDKFLVVNAKQTPDEKPQIHARRTIVKKAPSPLPLLKEAYQNGNKGNGVLLSQFGSEVKKLKPDFAWDTKAYPTFHAFLDSFPETFRITNDHGQPRLWMKEKKNGMIVTVKGTYSFAKDEEGFTYFVYKKDILPEFQDTPLKEGMKVRFAVSKEPSPEGKNSRERNGKATELEII